MDQRLLRSEAAARAPTQSTRPPLPQDTGIGPRTGRGIPGMTEANRPPEHSGSHIGVLRR